MAYKPKERVMKRIIALIASGAIFSAMAQEGAVLTVATPLVSATGYQVGDSCTYTQRNYLKPGVTYREVVIGVAPAGVRISKEGLNGRVLGSTLLTSIGNPLRNAGRDGVSFHEGEKRYFNPPHTPGKSWSLEYVLVSDGVRGAVKQRATVVGQEQITVPAGTFSAVRIRYAGFMDQGIYNKIRGWLSYNEEIWYDEETRCIVKLTRDANEVHYVRELLDWYRPGVSQ